MKKSSKKKIKKTLSKKRPIHKKSKTTTLKKQKITLKLNDLQETKQTWIEFIRSYYNGKMLDRKARTLRVMFMLHLQHLRQEKTEELETRIEAIEQFVKEGRRLQLVAK